MAAITTTIAPSTSPGAPLPTTTARKRVATSGVTMGATTTTTYFYRTQAGVRGSVTSVAAIPALAVVTRTVSE